MHSDKENPMAAQDMLDASKESTLEWLMEMDRDEPEERLFVVEDAPAETSLNSQEAEFAARPMTRGRAGADDLNSYISEEIVMSADGGSTSAGGDNGSADEPDALMAIDFSRQNATDGVMQAPIVLDGSDILGLADEDDIGDSFLVAKRIPKAEIEPTHASLPTSAAERPASQPETVADSLPTPQLPEVSELESVAEKVEDVDLDEVVTTPASDEVLAQAEPLQVDDQGTDFEPVSGNSLDDGMATLPVDDVTTYVASVEAPLGDEAFDEYLVAGSELDAGDEDIDALLPLEDELAFSVDAELDDTVDLDDDFAAIDGFEDDIMSVITPRIASFMEEVNAAVGARLVALGRPGNSVEADISIAADTETAASAAEQGYEPVMQICTAVPDALEGLEPSALDAMLLRLRHVETGESCNRLFTEEPTAPVELPTAPVLSVVESTVFDDELFVEDIDAELPAADWAPQNDEIDAIFDDFGSDEAALELDVPLPDVEELTTADTVDADDAPPVSELESASDESGLMQVFDEDIFDTDIEEAALEAGSPEDIERLLQDLGAETEAPGEICGVDVEVFADGTANEAPAVTVEQQDAEPPGSIPAVASVADDMKWCVPEGIKFHHSSPSSGEIFAEFLDAFIEEGSSELEKLEDAVGAWETEIGNEQAFTQVTRILHTIKGIAKGVGLHFYGTLIHNFETLLDRMPRPEAGEEHEYFRIVNAWLDAAVRGLDFVQEQRRDILSEFPSRGAPAALPAESVESVPPDDTDFGAAEVESAAALPEAAAQPAADIVAVQAQEKDARRRREDKRLADEGAKALAAQQSVRITSEKLDLLLNLSNQAQQLGVRTAQSTNRNKRASAELMGRLSSVRAHIADIADRTLFNVNARGVTRGNEMDALEMDQYSDLQEAANILREGVEDLADLIEVASRHNAQAEALLKQQASVIGSIGSTIRAARVVPVSRLMPGLRRLVRTVSNDLDKDVAFRVANELGTLDRDDYTRCQTILEHMVRNALDHGIETTEERKLAGKPSVGQITIDVRMSGGDSVIVLSDDGRGIDPDAMRESALRKGLDIDVDGLSDDEARNLIFHKGFSTAQTLSQISGRGVGMDIVMSELQQMGGEIRIESTVGKGTSFHIRVPSNVTVNGALLVSAGDNSYAIPLGGLVSVDEVPVDAFFDAVEKGETLKMSGMECEPAYLGTLCHSCNLPERSVWRNTVPVIVAGSEARFMAIAIDDVEEALELVIRSLGAQFASVPGVAGAATTADGEAVVALDLNVLVGGFGEDQATAVAEAKPEEEKFLALVVDDSRTQRMVATSQLETVGINTATAENGAVAIDWLNTTEHLPDVILLDVEMPVKDGIQTLREIRKSARYSHIPVIMVTSRTGIKHRTMAEEAGCNGYMGKPFNFRMLIGQINELTGHRLELG